MYGGVCVYVCIINTKKLKTQANIHLKALLYIIYTSMNSVELPPIWMWVAFTKNKSAKSKVAYSKYPMPVFSEYTSVLLSSLTRVKWPLNKHLKVYRTSEMPVKNIM